MRLIDADELASITYHGTEGRPDKFDDGVLWVLDKIDNLPTIDAAPVVLCRECKYWTSINNEETYGWCYFDNKATRKAKHFCAYGKRRGDGDANG